MSTTTTSANAPVFYFNNYSIAATYSFSEYSTSKATKTNKVWLNMVFTHPTKEESVVVRAAKSSRLLNQPKEVIEAIAQRDIRNYLSFSLNF